LTLRTFHSGGSAGDDITTGLPRVQEILEVRTPKGQAYLTEIAGDINVWTEGSTQHVQVTPVGTEAHELKLDGRTVKVASGSEVTVGDVLASKDDNSEPLTSPISGTVEVLEDAVMVVPTNQTVKKYEIPSFKELIVKDGDQVRAGQKLTSGSVNLRELMEAAGVEETQRYMMNEVLRIFAGQGQNIDDKHLEIIVRQMFSRVQIEEAGDSEFVTGDVASKQSVLEANERLAAEGKELIRYNQLLLGITKASLATDSFLSAASFQDTTRVLISAATSGRVDNLFGLKENVILGRLIPVGTGAQDDEDDEDTAENFVNEVQQAEPTPSEVAVD